MAIKNYISNSITLCAFLLTQGQGIELLDIIEDKFHRFSFILSNPERCDELRHHYLNGASAPARDLFSKREMLLGEIKTKNTNPEKGGNDYEV